MYLGCYVILWDLNTNKKVSVHSHENTVTCVQFIGSNYNYLLSIDSQSTSSLILTHWPSSSLVQSFSMPKIIKDRPVQKYSCSYSSQNYIIISENYKEQYAFSLWELKSDSLTLLASHREDVLSQCININIFDSQQGRYALFFATIEKRTIKYWGYNKQKLELVHKIHVKENILDSIISPLTQFLLFIMEPGKLCIINKEVKLIIMLKYADFLL